VHSDTPEYPERAASECERAGEAKWSVAMHEFLHTEQLRVPGFANELRSIALRAWLALHQAHGAPGPRLAYRKRRAPEREGHVLESRRHVSSADSWPVHR
jgi:hypothetical protein